MEFKNKQVTVFGLGRSGLSALKLLVREGALVSAVNSGSPDDWPQINCVKELILLDNCYAERDSSSIFKDSDLIIISPGISANHIALAQAVKRGVPIWSEIELASHFTDLPIIAVTGTNGKTTTVSFLGDMLESAGTKAFIGGNIGIPFCEAILSKEKYDLIVLELSSFQLESIHSFRPDVAVILNVFPNHGERYDGIIDYAEAKFNITKNMRAGDLLIYPSDYEIISKWAEKENLKKISFNTENMDDVILNIEKKFSLAEFKLVGNHNLVNLNFALLSLSPFNIRVDGIQNSINNFGGVAHRLQYLETDKRYTVYNDAKSTNWDATLTAVSSIDKENNKLYLIIGGQRRGKNDEITPSFDSLLEKVDCFILIGDTADDFEKEIGDRAKVINAGDLNNVKEILDDEGFSGILLFSPAFPSFDQFKNYIVRGETFISVFGK